VELNISNDEAIRPLSSNSSFTRHYVLLTKMARNMFEAALKFGSEAWVLKKREEKRLEAAQMKF